MECARLVKERILKSPMSEEISTLTEKAELIKISS